MIAGAERDLTEAPATEAPDVLTVAIEAAKAKRDTLRVGDFAWTQLHGAILLAEWVNGFTQVDRAAHPVTREIVAKGLKSVMA